MKENVVFAVVAVCFHAKQLDDSLLAAFPSHTCPPLNITSHSFSDPSSHLHLDLAAMQPLLHPRFQESGSKNRIAFMKCFFP